MFEWGYLTTAVTDQPKTVYRLKGKEVARLSRHVDGHWIATLDQHLPWERRRDRDCRSFESGQAGIEAWARRHADRLAAEVAAIDVARPYRSWMPAGQKDQPR
ncbi:hypothetical protein ACHZ97_14560 [Lysobacter soli]|uniref:hypothetical protein n=1 Tax=Lysobacter soli TaxID=453783 RepID=UPI0037C6E778